MVAKRTFQNKRKRDPYLDRRIVEDRREAHSADYFLRGGQERRSFRERRGPLERRRGCTRIGKWSSVCVGRPRSRTKIRLKSGGS